MQILAHKAANTEKNNEMYNKITDKLQAYSLRYLNVEDKFFIQYSDNAVKRKCLRVNINQYWIFKKHLNVESFKGHS